MWIWSDLKEKNKRRNKGIDSTRLRRAAPANEWAAVDMKRINDRRRTMRSWRLQDSPRDGRPKCRRQKKMFGSLIGYSATIKLKFRQKRKEQISYMLDFFLKC